MPQPQPRRKSAGTDLLLTREQLPSWATEVNIEFPITDLQIPERDDNDHYRSIRVLVRLHRYPLGYITLSATNVSATSVCAAIWKQLGVAINGHLEEDSLDTVSSLRPSGLASPELPTCQLDTIIETQPLISVVVCTHNRPEGARRVLRELQQLRYDNFEVVLVDNAPSGNETELAFKETVSYDDRFYYVQEPVAGLSRARNRGARDAHGEFVAFTDDDVRVDESWLNGVARGFRRSPDVGCVTGLVTSAQLENPVQLYFDQRVTWGSSCIPRYWDMVNHRDNSTLYPYSAGMFGTGANFSFDRQMYLDLGGCDEALGAGTPSGGGEDIDMFVRVLLAGRAIAYEPSALMGHIHRIDFDELGKQMFVYGTGFGAFAAKYLLSRRTGPGVVARIPSGVLKLRLNAHRAAAAPSLPKSLQVRELTGMLKGPFSYLLSRHRYKK